MSKDKVLLLISILALAASGWILYASFGSGLGFSLPFTTTTEVPPAQQSVNNVQILDTQIQRSLNNLKPTGLWQSLLNNEQYKSLSDFGLPANTNGGVTNPSGQTSSNIDIGEHNRPNPFEPLVFPSDKSNAQQ